MIMKHVSRGVLAAMLCISSALANTYTGQIELPALQSSLPHWGATAFTQLKDGRVVYGNNARLFVQDAFGGSAFTQITNCPAVDPSTIVVADTDQGEYIAMGAGGFGASAFYYTADPYTGGASAQFLATTETIQNYCAVIFGDRAYVAGGLDGGKHAVAAMSFDTKIPQLVIGDVSTYSAGIAIDSAGNLYVADNDDNKVYRFSKAQLDAAVTATNVLGINDGTYVCQFTSCGTIAVDGYGRVWATGYLTTGVEVYNPDMDRMFSYIPSVTNANYKVSAFSVNDNMLVSYVNQSGWITGAPVEYGWNFANSYAKDHNRDFHSGYTSACDNVVYHPAAGNWLIRHPDGSTEYITWGWTGAFPVPGDYDGDGITDAAVFSFEDGNWIIRPSKSPETAQTILCGWEDVLPVQGDYDGDGRVDAAVFYPEAGAWIITSSMTGQQTAENFGWSETWPVVADYDGDGRADKAVYHAPDGTWLIQQSSTDTLATYAWGWSGALPVPGDYDGDNIQDVAIFNRDDGAWVIRQSSNPAEPLTMNWGWSGAWPVPADYDGDGIIDIAVYGINEGAWIIRQSSAPETPLVVFWGFNEVLPVTSIAGLDLIY